MDPDLAPALRARLEALGCRFEVAETMDEAVFHHLSRRVSLEELAGFDVQVGTHAATEADPTE